ncbi:MAG: wax ester/triacylglycerol synthase domain-containing protein [Acidimicrobiia bacterium]
MAANDEDSTNADVAPPEPEIVYESRMSDADALMWNIEKDPMLRSTITSVVVIEGEVDHEALRSAIERLTRAVPRLRQRVRGNPYSLAPPRWEVDPNFDLGYHLRFVASPGKGTVQDILRLAEPIAMQGFDRARPIWECTYVTGGEANTSALIMKIHHSVTDGVGGVQLMLELFDFDREPAERPQPDPPAVEVLNQTQRFLDALAHQTRTQGSMAQKIARDAAGSARSVLADPMGSVESAGEMAESVARLLAPASNPLGPVLQDRSLSCHFDVLRLPIDAMKAAGHAVGGKLNDAFVAGILLGIRRYHHELGSELEALRMGMPISIRTDDGTSTAGNSFVPARFQIAADSDDPIDALRETHDRLQEIVHEPAYALVDPLSALLNRFPATVTTGIFGSMMRGLDFQASNVPGSPLPMYLLGHEVQRVVPFGPMAGAGVNVTLLSYGSDLNIGINVDPAAVTDQPLFARCLEAAYGDVMSVGDVEP